MLDFWSVNNIAFDLIGYPMSYIEFLGTILYLWSVWLVTKQKMLNWAIGIISSLLYMALFYQIRLYSDMFEQLYFIIRKSPKRLETTRIYPVEENRTAVLTAVDIPQIEKLRKTGNVSLDKVHGQYYPNDTFYNPIGMFNRSVLEQRTGYASTGRFFNICREHRFSLSLVSYT
jgi:hypothetical protein